MSSLIEILVMATTISAITSGLVQAIKKTKLIPKDFLPLTAVFVGIILGGLAVFIEIDLASRLWAGGISGLASVGLFELGKQKKENGD